MKKWQARVLRLVGTGALLGTLLWFVPVREILEAFREVRLSYALVGLLLTIVGWGLVSYQLYVLIRRKSMPHSFAKVFEIGLVSRFYGQFLPGELSAGAIKLYRLARPGKQWGEALAALAFARLMDTLTLVVLGLGFWAGEMPEGRGRFIGIILFGLIVLLVLLHAAVARPGTYAWLRRILPDRAFSSLRGRIVEKGRELVETAVESYRLFGGAVWLVVVIAVAHHLVAIVAFDFFARAVGVEISYLTIGWIRVVLHVLLMLPISVSGFGVREGGLVILLQDYGVEPSSAVALSLLLFARTFIGNAIGGLAEVKNVLRSGRWRLPTDESRLPTESSE